MGIIELNSKRGIEFGFTSDKFNGWLWESDNNTIWISFIESLHEGQGNLRKLFGAIEAKGYKIIVPTPFPRMEAICKKLGMKKSHIYSDDFEYLEIMTK